MQSTDNFVTMGKWSGEQRAVERVGESDESEEVITRSRI